MRELSCMSTQRLAAIFASAAPLTAHSTRPPERELVARVEAGRAAWPELSLDEGAFVTYLARHADERLPPMDRTAELWLACACANGSPGAVAAFEERYRGAIERAAARVDHGVVEEATQIVLGSLLVRDGAAPARIAAYGGRCSLSTWLSTVSARAAMKLRRRAARTACVSASRLELIAEREHPDLTLLRAKYALELEAALGAALASLRARSRVLLRLHYLERWQIERLAALYEVSRATMVRWLAATREELYASTKERLRDRLDVTSTEFASIAGLLGSDLQVSLGRVLEAEESRGNRASSDSDPFVPRVAADAQSRPA
jgi:RNA polymerase sigma-70 factor (ECF subfamily)